MMIRVFVATTATLVLFSGAGTAAAAAAVPIKGAPELTNNALYKVGKLSKISCKGTKGTTRASTTKYAKKLIGCLNAAWKPAIKDFTPVEVKFRGADDKESCSSGLEVASSIAEICGQAVEIRLADDWIKAKDDLAMWVGITSMYSGVVLGQTGIGQAWWSLPNSGEESEMKEQNRRFYLQDDCLAGVSLKSLGRTVKDWKPVLGLTHPDEFDRFYKRSLAKPANRIYWFKKGYQAGGPGACNTWKAPSSKVA